MTTTKAGAGASDKDVEQHIKELEVERCNALLNSDIPYLEALFTDDFIYMHASGRFEDKETYLAPRRSSRIGYDRIAPQDLKVRVYHGVTAVLTGRVKLAANDAGTVKIRDHRFTSTWVRSKKNPDIWQFASYAAAAVPDGAP